MEVSEWGTLTVVAKFGGDGGRTSPASLLASIVDFDGGEPHELDSQSSVRW